MKQFWTHLNPLKHMTFIPLYGAVIVLVVGLISLGLAQAIGWVMCAVGVVLMLGLFSPNRGTSADTAMFLFGALAIMAGLAVVVLVFIFQSPWALLAPVAVGAWMAYKALT